MKTLERHEDVPLWDFFMLIFLLKAKISALEEFAVIYGGSRMAVPIVQLQNVDKWFDEDHIVKNCSLDIREGEFLTLLGPSGCGKTTILRMISGFEHPTSGKILFSGEDVDDREPYERDVNTVFQNYALFPNMNVFDNIGYGLKVKKVPKDEIAERVSEMLKLVHLEGFEKRRINQMSGGQKQRVAIARALINRPKVLLLDEPLGALDMKLRKQMQIDLRHLQTRLGTTFVFVTHDQEEALTMSDRIAVMSEGVIEQIGTPYDIYMDPKTRFVANFIGESNLFEGDITEVRSDRNMVVQTREGPLLVEKPDEMLVAEGYSVPTSVAALTSAELEGEPKTVAEHAARRLTHMEAGQHISICLRPEDIKVSRTEPEGPHFSATAKDKIFIGDNTRLMATTAGGKDIRISHPDTENLPEPGESFYFYCDPKDAVVILE